jgi:hypothetical protein
VQSTGTIPLPRRRRPPRFEENTLVCLSCLSMKLSRPRNSPGLLPGSPERTASPRYIPREGSIGFGMAGFPLRRLDSGSAAFVEGITPLCYSSRSLVRNLVDSTWRRPKLSHGCLAGARDHETHAAQPRSSIEPTMKSSRSSHLKPARTSIPSSRKKGTMRRVATGMAPLQIELGAGGSSQLLTNEGLARLCSPKFADAGSDT